MIDLSRLGVGVTVWNVWDLPLWAWRAYRDLVDDWRRKQREQK